VHRQLQYTTENDVIPEYKFLRNLRKQGLILARAEKEGLQVEQERWRQM
jgi:hypothetical protein